MDTIEDCKGDCSKEDYDGLCNTFSGFFVCTRNSDHKGDHIACGNGNHNLETWKQEENTNDQEKSTNL